MINTLYNQGSKRSGFSGVILVFCIVLLAGWTALAINEPAVFTFMIDSMLGGGFVALYLEHSRPTSFRLVPECVEPPSVAPVSLVRLTASLQ